MKDVFVVYFKHKSILFYFFLLFCSGAYLLNTKSLLTYWPIGFTLFSAPIFEWAVHKYFLHYPFEFKNKRLKKFFYKIHEGHHEAPSDKELIFAPTIVGLAVPFIFFILVFGITSNFEMAHTAAFFSLAYYCYYEWVHLAHHTDSYTPITKRGRRLKKHHTFHHFKNENYWWGVTTILGDQIFNTDPTHNNIKKSKTTKNIFAKTPKDASMMTS